MRNKKAPMQIVAVVFGGLAVAVLCVMAAHLFAHTILMAAG